MDLDDIRYDLVSITADLEDWLYGRESVSVEALTEIIYRYNFLIHKIDVEMSESYKTDEDDELSQRCL